LGDIARLARDRLERRSNDSCRVDEERGPRRVPPILNENAVLASDFSMRPKVGEERKIETFCLAENPQTRLVVDRYGEKLHTGRGENVKVVSKLTQFTSAHARKGEGKKHERYRFGARERRQTHALTELVAELKIWSYRAHF